MSEGDEKSDLLGIGKVARQIPPQSWEKLVSTACETFSDLLSPITETTSGVGRLVRAKFGKMVEVEKVLAADAVARARAKVETHKGEKAHRPKASVLVGALDAASCEGDEEVRSIWSNMIANEAVSSDVHPDFPNILSRMSKTDVLTLAKITEANSNKSKLEEFVRGVRLWGISVADLLDEEAEFSHEQLATLNLIKKRSGKWELTRIGDAFVKALSDPSLGGDAAEQNDPGDA